MNKEMSLSKNNYIEICGVIASGKSTIAALLQQIGFTPVLEKFDINPFLQQFYEKPEDHALETEIAFLLQHYNHIKRAKKENKPFVCDFSLLLDLVFSDVTLTDKEQKVFMAVYNEVSSQVSYPDVLIHLHCDHAILLNRIQKRGREIEKTITIEYLQQLDEALSKRINDIKKDVKIISVDSEKYNFAHNENDKKYIIQHLTEQITA
ncbi:MAG: deoxynucleoside kinase [Candidatus Latescibacteria bacterium]|nr:deoxynucleoside kinase [Candidatus Latescibacterota bacterium]